MHTSLGKTFSHRISLHLGTTVRWLGSVVEGDVSCDDEGEFLFAGILPESKANHDRGHLTFSSRWRLL